MLNFHQVLYPLELISEVICSFFRDCVFLLKNLCQVSKTKVSGFVFLFRFIKQTPCFDSGAGGVFCVDKELRGYADVAAHLLNNQWYQPLLNVILDCLKSGSEKAFIVLDCASGAGKTQLGFSLMMLANSITPFMLNGMELEVAHIVWPSSVASQDIYASMQRYQHKRGIDVSSFFSNMKIWLQRGLVYDASITVYENSLWDNVFSHLFKRHTKRWAKQFVIILDEIPVNAEDLALIGNIRDSLKIVKNVVVILSGTNSKAANMIGITNGAASSRNIRAEHTRWSYLITRVPRYFVEASRLKNSWKDIQCFNCSKISSKRYKDLKSAIKAINVSIQNNGNPRLIDFSIDILGKLLTSNAFSFAKWQQELSKRNLESKFIANRFKYGKEILVSQANLLLSASAVWDIADSMIRSHYAQRAYPDNGLNFGLANKEDPCGGWLHIAPMEWRCLGHPLYANNEQGECPGSPTSNWQITIFQPLVRDPILYLASCWANGYFSIQYDSVSPLVFTSMTLTRSFWKPNSIGGLNFQNPKAIINTGARLKVAVTLAIMNAAAVSQESSMHLSLYLRNFLLQLNIQHDKIKQMMLDKAWVGLYIPRLIFPVIGFQTLNIPGIGILQRTTSKHGMDAILHNVSGRNRLGESVKQLNFEMKDRKRALTTTKIVEIVQKLIIEPGGIAICCARKCPLFWTQSAVRTKLWRKLEGTDVGVVYLINSYGAEICHTLNSDRKGRFILVEVGDVPGFHN
jgi:hypothetical protein